MTIKLASIIFTSLGVVCGALGFVGGLVTGDYPVALYAFSTTCFAGACLIKETT